MPEVVHMCACVGISRKLHIGILFFQLTEWHNRLAGDLRPNQHSARGIAHWPESFWTGWWHPPGPVKADAFFSAWVLFLKVCVVFQLNCFCFLEEQWACHLLPLYTWPLIKVSEI